MCCAHAAAFGIKCILLRQRRNKAHESRAWNTFPVSAAVSGESAYIALQQQEQTLRGNASGIRAFAKGTDPMAFTTSHDLPFTAAPTAKRVKGPGLFSRIYAVIAAARMRQAEREIARYLYGNGGKFTDEAEREIERRFLAQDRRF
jgi:hypothetical protein